VIGKVTLLAVVTDESFYVYFKFYVLEGCK
jgi:hypothetical protein